MPQTLRAQAITKIGAGHAGAVELVPDWFNQLRKILKFLQQFSQRIRNPKKETALNSELG